MATDEQRDELQLITITLSRKCAEELYIALALAGGPMGAPRGDDLGAGCGPPPGLAGHDDTGGHD